MIRGLARAGLALACAGLAAGCGTQTVKVAGTGPPPVTVPLSTSLVTAQGTWAIAVMGGSAASDNNFWQLFVRPTGASRWSLATPPGVADNGGLVAAGGGTSLTVGFRPSQDLAFSPLATSTDDGKNWTPGLLGAGLAGTPGAIAVAASGRALALLQDGTIQAAPTASAAAAGQWTQLTTLKALAASAPGRSCGLTSVHAVSFGPGMSPMAAGSCERPGVAGVFTYASGTVAVGGAGAARDVRRGPGAGARADRRFRRRRGAAAGREQPARRVVDGTRWTVSDPVPAGTLRATGFGASGSAWVLLGGGRAETIGGPGGSWQALPPAPPGTATLAPPGAAVGSATGGATGGATAAGSYEALAVSGSRLTVWRLAQRAWAKVQLITVPIQYGSSS